MNNSFSFKRRSALLVLLLHSLPVLAAQPPILIGVPRTHNDYYGKVAIRVYDEIFRRLGRKWEYKSCVPSQCGKYVSLGQLDGEAGRSLTYQKRYPDLIYCHEPVLKIYASAFAKKNIPRLDSWDALSRHDYVVTYVTGIYIIGHSLQGRVPEKNIRRVQHWHEGIDKLLRNQADVLIEVEKTVLNEIHKNGYPIHRVGRLQQVDLYPYFNKKHQQLAQAMAKVIHRMKQEGVLDKLSEQSE